jgi:phage repressor protein C with HTH and peptisase S24 domain
MQTFDLQEISGRFRSKRLENKLSQIQFGEQVGIQQSAVSAIEKGDRLPTTEQLLQVIGIFGGSADWWLFGRGVDNPSVVSEPQETYTATMPVRGLAGAGNPCCIDQLESIGQITVEKGYDGPNIQVVKIRGTSMEPTIMDGGYVGIDVTSKEIISGQMYAVYIPHEGTVVKRIWIGPELVKIASDNPTSPDHDMMSERINWDTFVQGRVSWVIQRYVKS